jgi:hypothetical protein
LERVAELLAEDGFSQSLPGLYYKAWKGEWTAWIGVPGTPYSLQPRVGIYSEDLVRIHKQAQLSLGDAEKEEPGVGPPLIMVTLERLIERDPDCTARISWHYHGNAQTTGPELKTEVADDLVYCLRKKAYPFMDAHLSLEAVVDAARAGMPSPALHFYVPIILLKMGRRGDVPKYVESWSRGQPDKTVVASFERYVTAVEDIFAPETKH